MNANSCSTAEVLQNKKKKKALAKFGRYHCEAVMRNVLKTHWYKTKG